MFEEYDVWVWCWILPQRRNGRVFIGTFDNLEDAVDAAGVIPCSCHNNPCHCKDIVFVSGERYAYPDETPEETARLDALCSDDDDTKYTKIKIVIPERTEDTELIPPAPEPMTQEEVGAVIEESRRRQGLS